MNCRDVTKQLPAYLDGEISPSEKKLIQSHLAVCKNCQQELEVLGLLQKDIRQHLQTRAADIAASPQAWATLKASLPSSPPGQSALERTLRSISFPSRLSLQNLTVQRMAIILVIFIAMVALAPPVWARLEPMITNWFSFSSPDGESEAAIGGFTAFTPYHATYLPEGFQQSLLGTTTSIVPEMESLEIGYDSDDQFIILVQSKGEAVTELAPGKISNVNEFRAIFIPSFASSRQEFVEKRPSVPTVTNYSYENTNLLSWFIGEIKIELFSNLPLEEMLKVAESLEPMLASEGEIPNP